MTGINPSEIPIPVSATVNSTADSQIDSDGLRPIRTAVVSDDYFARDVMPTNVCNALLMHVTSVSASFRQGITMETSG
jgi:hypothetical protein